MKAAVLRDGKIAVEDMPEPERGSAHILARPIVCGICGSDLHARDNAAHLCDLVHRAGFRGFMDPAKPVVMGHEFCCEVLEASPDHGFARGQRVVALPFLNGPKGIELLGYSNLSYGGFAEQMLLQPELTFAVPDHVPDEIAAMTEPLSVAVHAVAEAGAGPDDAFVVVGCGPVGLFVIARLRALGLGPILAVEPDPVRAKMAEQVGADIVIAPGGDIQEKWWTDLGLPLGLSDSMAVDPNLRKRKRAVLFECVGKPGMLMRLALDAPIGAKIIVIGNCMETDQIEPAFLLQKGLSLQFVFAYTTEEFVDAFKMVCADPERLRPLLTGEQGLAQTSSAFDALARGGGAIKIQINPANR